MLLEARPQAACAPTGSIAIELCPLARQMTWFLGRSRAERYMYHDPLIHLPVAICHLPGGV